jgi:hypothetical protein
MNLKFVEFLSNQPILNLLDTRYLPRTHKNLSATQKVHVVEFPGYQQSQFITQCDFHLLVTSEHFALPGR